MTNSLQSKDLGVDDDSDRRRSKKHTIVLTNRVIKPRRRVFAFVFDRFLKDKTYHGSQVNVGWTQELCSQMHRLAQEATDHTLPFEVSESDTKTCGHVGKNKMDQEQLYNIIEGTLRRCCPNFDVQRKHLSPVEPITSSTSLDHSSSRNGSDGRSRSNSSRSVNTSVHVPTVGINLEALTRRSF